MKFLNFALAVADAFAHGVAGVAEVAGVGYGAEMVPRMQEHTVAEPVMFLGQVKTRIAGSLVVILAWTVALEYMQDGSGRGV